MQASASPKVRSRAFAAKCKASRTVEAKRAQNISRKSKQLLLWVRTLDWQAAVARQTKQLDGVRYTDTSTGAQLSNFCRGDRV